MSTRRNFLSDPRRPRAWCWVHRPPRRRSRATAAFEPDPQADDASVFAAAREQFLIPAGVAYCNTGTLGASPREVVEALNEGVRPPRNRTRGLALRASRRRTADGVPAAARCPRCGGAVHQRARCRHRAHAERDDGHELPRQWPRPGRGRRGHQHRPGARRLHLALAPAREAARHRRQGTAAGAGTRRRAGRDRASSSSPR